MEEKDKMCTLDAREMALKCSTKGEVYKVLSVTGAMHLPPVEQVNWDFVRDLLCGDKLVSLSIKYILYCLKSSKNYRSATYWRTSNSRNTWVC